MSHLRRVRIRLAARGALVAALACLAGLTSAAMGHRATQPPPGSRHRTLVARIRLTVPPATVRCGAGNTRQTIVWGARFPSGAPAALKVQTAVYGDRAGRRGPFHIERQFFARDGSGWRYTSWSGARCGGAYLLIAHAGIAPGARGPKHLDRRPHTYSFAVGTANNR